MRLPFPAWPRAAPLAREAPSLPDDAASGRRLPFLDIARGLAVLFMIATHARELYGYSAMKGTAVGETVRFLGESPAAPVFLFAMGASFALAPRSSPGGALRKAAWLLALAYLLNALKFVVPMLVLRTLPAVYAADARAVSDLHPALFFLLLGDVLQLAAAALALIALVRRYVRRFIPVSLALAALIAAVSPWLWGYHAGIRGVDHVLDLLWGNGVNVYFPVFPWAAFPFLGLAAGGLLQRHAERRGALFAGLFFLGLLLAAAGVLLTRGDPARHFADYYRPTPARMLIHSGFLLSWSAVCHWLGKAIAGTLALRGLRYLSKHVTLLFVLQWTILYWGLAVIGLDSAGVGETFALIVLVTALTVLAGQLFLALKAAWTGRRPAAGASPEQS